MYNKTWTTPIPYVMHQLGLDLASTGGAYWEVRDDCDEFRITRMNEREWYYKYG